MKRRANHEGTYEKLPKGRVRLVAVVDGKRIVGPASATKLEARERWREKFEALEDQNDAKDHPTVASEVYFCLFGVYAPTGPEVPTTRGPWAHELAESTFDLYRFVFRRYLRADPIAEMDPRRVSAADLEAYRTRLLADLPGRRSALRYMAPVLKVLRRHGNGAASQLGRVKLPRIEKGLLRREDLQAFLDLMPSDNVRLAVRIMLHGVTVSECCGLLGRHVVDGELVIEEQYIQRKGKGVRTKELKRPRRYRRVPISPTLLPDLDGLPAGNPIIEGRVTRKRKGPHPMERTSLGRAISRAVAGTKFEGISPHDLRSSGAKWMLDAGAKLSDVAAILGNDPRVLLAHYDQPDDGGKRRAVGVL